MALIVVMVLFFIVSMVAAYTNRNLIFEQRMAANLQRSTRALEAAEAGVEWALTMLNRGRINATCDLSTNPADTSFRDRYLVVNGATGDIVPRKRSDGSDLYPTCVFDAGAWTCSCPVDSAPTMAAPSTSEYTPAFRVRFRRICGSSVQQSNLEDSACATPTTASAIRIDVNACTTPSEACLAFPDPASPQGEARSSVYVVAGLAGGVPMLPQAALTVGQTLTVDSPGLFVANSDPAGKGISVHAGNALAGTNVPTLQGKAGTPPAQSAIWDDNKLEALSTSTTPPERMFVNTFGMRKVTFAEQPAAIVVDCSAGCSASQVRNKISLNPGRPLVLDGNVDFDSSGDIGSATNPVLLNVTGSVNFSANVNIFGLLYSQAGNWDANGSGTSQVVGAAIAENNMRMNASSLTVNLDRSVLLRLHSQSGSFIRLPGTWRDFKGNEVIP